MKERNVEMETKQRKVLIVDDDEAIQRILSRIVEKIGRECETAASAEEARRIMDKEVFDLILCDIHRPYRAKLGIDKALDEISKNRGVLYDPEAADACLKIFKDKEFHLE